MQLAAGFNDYAVGARRQTENALAFSDGLHQQGAVGSAVEHAKLAGSVQGNEALAALFGGDFNDRRSAHLEGANLLQTLFAIGIAGHEPLGQATLGIADDQRDAAHQLGAGGDLRFTVFKQFVATVEALVAQAEHVSLGTPVDHVQPLLTRVDEDTLHRLVHLRQFDALLLVGDFAGHHVLFAGQRQNIELRTGGADQHQGRIVGVETDMLKRTAGFVQGDWRFAIRVLDGRGDGFLAFRVADFIGVTEYQCLTVGQTHRHQRVAWLVFTDGGHGGAGRNRQIDALEFGATVDVEEQCLALVGNPHRHLVLLFQGDHQRLAGVLHPGWRNSVLGGQTGTLEQGRDNVGKEEEDQCDGCQHRQAADKDVPAGEAILERADATLAL
ncbi:hypothetical protein D3C85_913250 [compost metagenome]